MNQIAMTHDEIDFALNRAVPAMTGSNFSIHTNYGELPIAAGKLADKIAELVRKHYETEQAYLALRMSAGSQA